MYVHMDVLVFDAYSHFRPMVKYHGNSRLMLEKQ